MKPNFALFFTDDAVTLLHRAKRGWLEIGHVPFDAADLAAELAFLRSTALGLAPAGVTTKLVIPNSQIKYLTIAAPGPDAIRREGQIADALEGVTPYSVDDLAFDWSGDGDLVQVAIVARETLVEAEGFAVEHRFNPISFVALPPAGAFAGEPIFGVSEHALAVLNPGEVVDADAEPIWVISHDAPMAEAPADDLQVAEDQVPTPEPVAETVQDPVPRPTLAPPTDDVEAKAAPSEPAPADTAFATDAPNPEAAPEIVALVPPEPALPPVQPDLFAPTESDAPAPEPTPEPAVPVQDDPIPDAAPAIPLALTSVVKNSLPPPVVITVPPAPVVELPPVPEAPTAPPEAEGSPATPPASPKPAPGSALDVNTDPLARATARIAADRAKALQTAQNAGAKPIAPKAPAPKATAAKAPAPKSPAVLATAKTAIAGVLSRLPKAKPSAKATPRPLGKGAAIKTDPITPAADLAPKAPLPPVPSSPAIMAKKAAPAAPKTAAPLVAPAKDSAEAPPAPKLEKPKTESPAAAAPLTETVSPALAKASLQPIATDADAAPKPMAAAPTKTKVAKPKPASTAPFTIAPKPAKKANLGLILTGGLLLLLALAAAGSSFYVSQNSDSDSTETADIPTAEDEILADLPDADLDTVNPAETGAETATLATSDNPAPVVTPATDSAPVAVDQTPAAEVASDSTTADEIFLGTADAPPERLNSIALPMPNAAAPDLGSRLANAVTAPPLPPTLVEPPTPTPTALAPTAPTPTPTAPAAPAPNPTAEPPAPALITPTPEGVKTPEGVTLFAGKPPIVPPPRPGSEVAATPETDPAAQNPANAALAAIRPMARPQDLAPAAAAPVPDAGDAAVLATLAAMRPAPRPDGLAPPAPADAPLTGPQAGDPSLALLQPDGDVSPLGLGPRLSPRPPARPEDMDQAIQEAVAAASQPAPTPEAEQEPDVEDTGPRTPTSANVAKEATEKNAIDLSELNLIGIYGPDSNHYAMIRKPSGRYERVEVGDRLDGGKVRAITASEVRYEKRGKIVVLTMPNG